MRDRAHYERMLENNPNATVGIQLAARAVLAAREIPENDREALREEILRLADQYGEIMSVAEVRAEMNP